MFVPRGARAGRAGPGPPGAGRAVGPDQTTCEHQGSVTRTRRLSRAAKGGDPERMELRQPGDLPRRKAEMPPGHRSGLHSHGPPRARVPAGGAGGPRSPHLELVRAALLGGQRRELIPPRPAAVSQPLRSRLHTEAPRAQGAQCYSGCSGLWVLSGRNCSVVSLALAPLHREP